MPHPAEPVSRQLFTSLTEPAGILKTHKLQYEPAKPLNLVYSKHTCKHRWTANHKVIHEWLSHFQAKLEEVTMWCGNDSMALKSFTEGWGGTDKNAPGQRSLQTELQVDVGDFDLYEVRNDVVITFTLKYLKAILSFAEAMGQPVTAYFDASGQPITFCVSQSSPELYIGDFVLATTNNGDDQESEFASQSSRPIPSETSQQRPRNQQEREDDVGEEAGAYDDGEQPEVDEDEEVPPSPPGFGAGMRSLVAELDRSRKEEARGVPGNIAMPADPSRRPTDLDNEWYENDLFTLDDGMEEEIRNIELSQGARARSESPESPSALRSASYIPEYTMGREPMQEDNPNPDTSFVAPSPGAGPYPVLFKAPEPLRRGSEGAEQTPEAGPSKSLRRPRMVEEEEEVCDVEPEILDPTPPFRRVVVCQFARFDHVRNNRDALPPPVDPGGRSSGSNESVSAAVEKELDGLLQLLEIEP
ncbi:cell cycle checkpoint control protein rad9a [Rhizophlyctis rosea]|uniref:Cell cycle checkpoint control protein rad9a n=1 Tax=Rhizophlyctis rosea TaxID=64517 RepID=A0AAD5S2I7_9FUNG|nr:cell cycle checkpoint control protein rad9a [Rhizophlyctis rosea]